MRRRTLAVVFFAAFAFFAPLRETHSSSRLAVIQDAPPFRLTTQAGEPLDSSALRGKVLLVGFVFTTCSGSCPATTARMAQVQRELHAGGLSERVRLVSISLDPARDRPDVLRNYARVYDADLRNWSFLTGGTDEIDKVVKGWGMWAKATGNGQLDHPSRVFLVDPRGRVREIYNLDFLKPAWVLDDVRQLLDEETPKRP